MAKMVTQSSQDIPNIWQAEQSAGGLAALCHALYFPRCPGNCMASNALDGHSARASSRIYSLKTFGSQRFLPSSISRGVFASRNLQPVSFLPPGIRSVRDDAVKIYGIA
jgi:hypothetical protein